MDPDFTGLVNWNSKKILSKITEKTEYGIELQVHDLIIRNVEYVSTNSVSEHTIEGVLLNKKAVCEGIAKAVKFLLNKKSIECEVVTGYTKQEDGVRHAWNVVKVDGLWYHLDVTWDLNMSTDGVIRYDYFNLSESEIIRDHIPDKKIVSCVTPRSCYYYRNDLVMHKQEDYRRFVERAIKENRHDFVIRLPSAKEPEEVYKKILDNTARVLKYASCPFSAVNVIYNKYQCVFRVIISR